MRHLFLALSTRGFGETILGTRLALELQQAGHDCMFIVHDSAAGVLAETPFRCLKVSDTTLPLLPLYLRSAFEQFDPDSVVLSDYFTTTLAFEKAGADFSLLKGRGLPVTAIDTWDVQRCGTRVDLYGKAVREMQDWRNDIDLRLIPTPLASPSGDGAFYSSLPHPTNVARKVRRHVRRDLGLAEEDALVLFCTAEWQCARYKDADARRLAQSLPRLVADQLRRLGPRVHLAHVGPRPYRTSLGERYHWLPAMGPEQFNFLLSSCDLLLSANVSATTIARALVSEVPALVLMNSHAAASPEDLPAALLRGASPGFKAWLEDSLPIFPFHLWPLGYHEFLGPMLAGNPLLDAVPCIELLDEKGVSCALSGLLFDAGSRQRAVERQLAYAREIGRLPRAAEALTAFAR